MCDIHEKLYPHNLQKGRQMIFNLSMCQSPKLFNQVSFSFRNSQLHIYNIFGSEAPRNNDSINQSPTTTAGRINMDFIFS